MHLGFLDWCKNKFLGHTAAIGKYGNHAVTSVLYDHLDITAFEQLPDILLRIISLHFFKKDIPHLIVWTKILDLPNQFIFCHCDHLKGIILWFLHTFKLY